MIFHGKESLIRRSDFSGVVKYSGKWDACWYWGVVLLNPAGTKAWKVGLLFSRSLVQAALSAAIPAVLMLYAVVAEFSVFPYRVHISYLAPIAHHIITLCGLVCGTHQL